MSHTTETLAAYHLGYNDTDVIVDESTDVPFDRALYSRMKYGDITATKEFANDVADVLLTDAPHLVESPVAPEFLVAYKAVPPACFYLSQYCLERLNVARLEAGVGSGQVRQVYKNQVATTDYAGASPEERQKELSGIGFSLDGSDIDNKPVVVLDDIKITGAAERCMLDVIEKWNPGSVTLGYIAIFNTLQALVRPSVERDLNLSVISTISDLLPAIQADNFVLNIRTLKMALATDAEELAYFLEQVPDAVLNAIVVGAEKTGEDFTVRYQNGLHIARTIQQKRVG